jgi:hypothetical protein
MQTPSFHTQPVPEAGVRDAQIKQITPVPYADYSFHIQRLLSPIINGHIQHRVAKD